MDLYTVFKHVPANATNGRKLWMELPSLQTKFSVANSEERATLNDLIKRVTRSGTTPICEAFAQYGTMLGVVQIRDGNDKKWRLTLAFAVPTFENNPTECTIKKDASKEMKFMADNVAKDENNTLCGAFVYPSRYVSNGSSWESRINEQLVHGNQLSLAAQAILLGVPIVHYIANTADGLDMVSHSKQDIFDMAPRSFKESIAAIHAQLNL